VFSCSKGSILMRHRILLLGVSLVTVAAVACGAISTPAPTANSTPTRETAVNTVVVTRIDLSSTLSLTGDVRARSTINVVPKVSGRIEKLLVDVGMHVEAGDVIAELDRVTADLQVAQAEAGLAAARSRLSGMMHGGRADQQAQAEANARAARARLAAMLDGPRVESVAQAVASLDIARQKLAAAQSQPRPETVAQAEANLRAAQARLDQLTKGPTEEQIQAVRLQVDQAKNALLAAQSNRDGVCGGRLTPEYACNAANAQAYAAETAVQQAEQQLRILTAPPTAELLAQSEAAVQAAQEQVNLVSRPVTPEDLAQLASQVAIAEQQLAIARTPFTKNDVEQARAAADAAEAGARLAARPFSDEDIEAAEAAVQQARVQLDLATLQVVESVIRAPVDGIISERFLVIGAMASPATPIVALTSTEVEVSAQVDEANLGLVATGQMASISVAAYPGQPFTGTIGVVAPTVDPRSRTALVKIIPDSIASDRLKPGMFAQIDLTWDAKSGVLAVPRGAVVDPGGFPSVFIVDDGKARLRNVQLGVSDGRMVEITGGLDEAMRVIVDVGDLRDGDAVALAGR
jgi:HlyD family secretion protein